MKEEWLFRGALVPIDAATTASLVAEIKRLIDVVGGMALAQTYPEYDRGFSNGWNKCEERQALAQPEQWAPEDKAYRPGGLAQPEQPTIEQSLIVEQEPVAWIDDNGNLHRDEPPYSYGPDPRPLYTSPPKRAWVGLTEWEREAIAVACGAASADWLVFVEAVERALKEKNA
jgi:hypothetical protein